MLGWSRLAKLYVAAALNAQSLSKITLGRIAAALGTRAADLCRAADEFESANKDK
jgi:hypothetical protein